MKQFITTTQKESKIMFRKLCSLVTAIFAILMLCSITVLAQQRFVAYLAGYQEVPAVDTPASGTCQITLDAAERQINVSCKYNNLTAVLSGAHLHGNAPAGQNAEILFDLNPQTGARSGSFNAGPFTLTAQLVSALRAKQLYVNLYTANFPNGEIRGQVKITTTTRDYDGDGRTDVIVFRQSENMFYILSSMTNSMIAYNLGSGVDDSPPSPTGDFDGDGRADPLLVKNIGTVRYHSILQSDTNTVRTVPWGDTSLGDASTYGDYDGDGRWDIAVFRRTTGVWYILESSTENMRVEFFGLANDFPSVGDYDKDGKTDLCVGRVEDGQRIWYIRNSSNNQVQVIRWGLPNDGFSFFAHTDIDADGATDFTAARTVSGIPHFYVRQSSNGELFTLQWGSSGDLVRYGDYDGDGKTEMAAGRDEGGHLIWYIYQSSNAEMRVVQFGKTGDR